MSKIISLLMLVAILIMPVMAEKKGAARPLTTAQDAQICDVKDQSSAESLLRAMFACQNSQRAAEIIDLVFLGTDIHDVSLGISETDEMLVPNLLRDDSITVKDWRAMKRAEFSRMNEQTLKRIDLFEVGAASMHDQNPFQFGTDETFEKALVRYAFTAMPENAGNEQEKFPQSGRHLIIFFKGKTYLNQFPFDLWELD